jgi:CheY-like chemotaxis protein
VSSGSTAGATVQRSAPTVLVAHERGTIGRIVTRVLGREGFASTFVPSGASALAELSRAAWDVLVVDVGLPDIPGYELVDRARALCSQGHGATFVVLVASVYRPTGYKRRPTRLYGADDYIEIHHLGDALPVKLRRLLGLPAKAPDDAEVRGATLALRDEGDARLDDCGDLGLAQRIVADVVLYNGDRILAATDVDAAAAAVSDDLEVARRLFSQVAHERGESIADGDPIGTAFRELMRALGRVGDGEGAGA